MRRLITPIFAGWVPHDKYPSGAASVRIARVGRTSGRRKVPTRVLHRVRVCLWKVGCIFVNTKKSRDLTVGAKGLVGGDRPHKAGKLARHGHRDGGCAFPAVSHATKTAVEAPFALKGARNTKR
jgi:hypothetical protein